MITKRSRHVMLDIQVMAWDRHKNVAGLNRSIEFNPLFLISDFKRQYKKNYITDKKHAHFQRVCGL